MPKRQPPVRQHRRRAAALGWQPERDRAPRIVARGEGLIAEKIIAIAREHGIPTFEDRALVDVLARLDVDTEIPPELYRAVAEIIAFLFRVRARHAAS